tara:strand:- start:112 stop:510 length:399 start_codon:yes stop_codon:yes gene_type:complete
MANNEHPDEEKYEAVELTVGQWEQVIEKAKNAEKSDLHMYILRSWANQQVVTNGSICAFRGKVIEVITDRKTGSTAIGTISKFVRDITGNPKATCYEWNTIKGEWTLGTFQTFSLRMALGAKRAPSGSEGIK